MKHITNEELAALRVPAEKYLCWVENALLHKAESVLPEKISMKMEEHVFYNVMPCILPYKGVAGVKIVNRYPERNPSIGGDLLLYRLADGELAAAFDAEYITTMRTGAVAAHAVKSFARKDFSFLALAGLGNVVSATFSMLAEIYREKKLTVGLLKYKDAHETFMQKYRFPNVEYKVYDAPESLFSAADVIVSGVTYREEDFAPLSCYNEGVLVVPVHTRGFMNCDAAFDRIFVDDYAHVKNFRYYDRFRWCRETAEYVKGVCEGRGSERERILCYNIGIALHDVYFASEFLKML